MYRIFVRSVFAISALSVLGAAEVYAEENVSFNYDPSISIEANYSNFKSKAKRACSRTPYYYPYKLIVACRADLLDQAVKAVKVHPFTKHHHQSLSRNGDVASKLRARKFTE